MPRTLRPPNRRLLSPGRDSHRTVRDAVDFVGRRFGNARPQIMVTLGSGLGGAIHPGAIDAGGFDPGGFEPGGFDSNGLEVRIGFAEVPGLQATGVDGHVGDILLGTWRDRRVLIFRGRLHLYEGCTWEQVTLPVEIAAALGATVCLFTNMSGAVNRRIRPGSLVIVDDHLNLTGSNPLLALGRSWGDGREEATVPPWRGGALGSWTEAPNPGAIYSPRLGRLLDEAAVTVGLELEHGTYAAVTGPNYETPAEVRALAVLGVDLIGMSTVGEAIRARSLGMECAAVSCVANHAAGVTRQSIRHEEVVQTAQTVQGRLASLLDSLLQSL